MNNKDRESIKRRLNYNEASRQFFDVLASYTAKTFRKNMESSYQKIPHRLCNIVYDLVESIRLRHIVPSFGDVSASVADLEPPIGQHPRNLSYWYDSSRHSMVGTHVGIDMISHGGKTYIIELNTNAGVREERRKLYKSRIDPAVKALVSFTRRLGFKKLVVINAGWASFYHSEFAEEGKKQGIQTVTASYPWFEIDTKNPIFELPLSLERDTLYINYYRRETPLEYYINNKFLAQQWLAEVLRKNPELGQRVDVPPTYDRLVVPPLEDKRWPNLVVKVAGKGQGDSMAMLQVSNEDEALQALGINDPFEYPKILRSKNIAERFADKLFQLDRCLYQRFIPPRIVNGHAESTRILIVITPLESSLLSTHRTLSTPVVPDECPHGLIQDLGPYLLNLCKGSEFFPPDENVQEEIDLAAIDICKIIDIGLKEKFSWSKIYKSNDES